MAKIINWCLINYFIILDGKFSVVEPDILGLTDCCQVANVLVDRVEVYLRLTPFHALLLFCQ